MEQHEEPGAHFPEHLLHDLERMKWNSMRSLVAIFRSISCIVCDG